MNRRQFLLALSGAVLFPHDELAARNHRLISLDTIAPSNSSEHNSYYIQKHIDQLTDKNAVLSIPPGDYRLNATINIVGMSDLTIKADGVKFLFDQPAPSLVINNSPNLKIEGLSIHYPKEHFKAFSPAVKIENSYRTLLDRVHIWNAPGSCITIKNSWWFSTQNCVFQKPGPDSPVVVQNSAMNNVLHFHTRFAGYRHVGDRTQCAGLVHDGGSGVSLLGCDFTGCQIGFQALKGRSLSMRDCYLERNELGVLIGSRVVGAIIEGNYFNTKEGKTREPIFIHNDAKGISSRNNVVVSCNKKFYPLNMKIQNGIYQLGESDQTIEASCK